MILVIDNFDSFTYNLVQYMALCGAETKVVRNNAISIDEIKAMRPDGILLSPGPCTPRESGVCIDVARAALADELSGTPLLGVCLGHQTVGYVAGSTIDRAPTIRHGKLSAIQHTGRGVFTSLPSPFNVVRYHSLVVSPETVSPDFEITATALDDEAIMGVMHRSLNIEGVQFHPESVLTEHGMEMVQRFVDRVNSYSDSK